MISCWAAFIAILSLVQPPGHWLDTPVKKTTCASIIVSKLANSLNKGTNRVLWKHKGNIAWEYCYLNPRYDISDGSKKMKSFIRGRDGRKERNPK